MNSNQKRWLILLLLVLLTIRLGVWEAPRLIGWLHYRRVVIDMEKIAAAAVNDFKTRGDYAFDVGPGQMPNNLERYLPEWPKPPCSGWVYDWDDWLNAPGGENTVRVTLRRADLRAVHFLCLSTSGSCAPSIFGGFGTPIETVLPHSISCNE